MDQACRRFLPPLVALGAVTHAPFLGGGLLTDDFVHFGRLAEQPSLVSVLTSPDPFHFYRPVPQAAFLLDALVFGMNPVAFRLMNLLLHVSVICAAFFLARRLLDRPQAAFFATLAFVLTPKAHTITVLWISARPELLMALFSLLACICWIAWDRDGRWWLLGAAWACYVLAFLSKETAALLPLLLLVTPPERQRLTVRRVFAALLMVATAMALLALRAHVGALMPLSADQHYNLATPVFSWLSNAGNYLPRALPSPIALLVIVGCPVAVQAWRRGQTFHLSRPTVPALTAYAGAWFAIFILPALPIVMRSELYLYLPGFGICVVAGFVVDAIATNTRTRFVLGIALSVYVVLLGGYQIARGVGMHQNLVFSAELVDALAHNQTIKGHKGTLLLVPEDQRTERLLRDSIGGYLDIALKTTFARPDIGGSVAYADAPGSGSALRIDCAFRDGHVVVRPPAGR